MNINYILVLNFDVLITDFKSDFETIYSTLSFSYYNKTLIMKPTFFILFFSYYFTTFGQIVTKELFKIQTFESNSKTITFHNQSNGLYENFIITALNKSSSDFTKCSWKVKLSLQSFKDLCQSMSEITFGFNNEVTYKNFSIKLKNDYVKIIFFNSSCLNEHKTHYFQKSCNRELSFRISPQQINSFVKIFNKDYIYKIVVKL